MSYVTELVPDNKAPVHHRSLVTPILESERVPARLVRYDVSESLIWHDYGFIKDIDVTELHSREPATYIFHDDVTVEGGDDIFDIADPVQLVNDQRISLLAKQYAGKDFIREDAARLEILTERIRNLLPSINESDVQILEELSAKVHHAGELNKRLIKEHNLDE